MKKSMSLADQNTENFTFRLRELRTSLNLTQAEADAVLDTCLGQVAVWERGRNTPHILTQEGALARLRNRKIPRKWRKN